MPQVLRKRVNIATVLQPTDRKHKPQVMDPEAVETGPVPFGSLLEAAYHLVKVRRKITVRLAIAVGHGISRTHIPAESVCTSRAVARYRPDGMGQRAV